jgi:hypothetical protein
MPASIWNACVGSRKCKEYNKIEISFVETPQYANPRLRNAEIDKFLTQWTTMNVNIDKIKLKPLVQRLGDPLDLKFHCELHCELQILLCFLQINTGSPEPLAFIGRSKLSCYLC